jgi:hypothetical protein
MVLCRFGPTFRRASCRGAFHQPDPGGKVTPSQATQAAAHATISTQTSIIRYWEKNMGSSQAHPSKTLFNYRCSICLVPDISTKQAMKFCFDRPSRIGRRPGTSKQATGRRQQSRRRSSGRTTAPGRLAAHSTRRRPSAHQRSPCARPRRAWPQRRHVLRRAPVPALGGLGQTNRDRAAADVLPLPIFRSWRRRCRLEEGHHWVRINICHLR